MAESIRSKANRYARGEFTNRELKILLGGMVADQVIDIATFGRLSKLKGKAFVKVVLPIVRKAGLATARAAPSATARLAGTAIGATRFVVMRHPLVAAAVVTYEVVKHREQIAQLAREGWEVIQDTGAAMAPIMQTEFERLITEGPRPSPGRMPPGFLTSTRPKRRSSKFNSAIKAGMTAAKKSTSYGGKGKIKPATKVFSIVTKLASAKMKKRKAPKSGIRRRIWNAMKGLR